ncbi:MAG TPA: M23 family metallopeptidase [Candidatus Fimenecus excrementigallinarum]|uniref:M23 family metallopeptidase n=1 Tax=Candidatus Fimenecus excrementigallinarum TaxID=2840816 RepID=A0A9D1IDH8_9FIRM|nr:M23 family metallopeptidase [Candidatus Fimenecus excrementigallinarum]
MENRNKKQNRRRFTRRAAALYLGCALALVGVGAAARAAVQFRLAPETDAADPQTEPPATARFSLPAPTAPDHPDTAASETPTGGVYAPEAENEAVAAQDDGIERAAAFAQPLGNGIAKGFSHGDMVQSKTMGDWRVHNGADYPGAVGDPVKAVNNGVVKAVYDDVLWGTVVEVDHGDGLLAKYCGLGRGSTAAVGEQVQVNDRIGNLGEIPVEAADDAHLHLELWQDGEAVDPADVLGA